VLRHDISYNYICCIVTARVRNCNCISNNLSRTFTGLGEADFIIEKIESGEFIVSLPANKYFLVVDKDREDVIVSFIDITNISYKFEHYMDIDSFLHEIKNPLAVIERCCSDINGKQFRWLYK